MSQGIDKLMDIFDVDLVAANSANEIHEAKLKGMRMIKQKMGEATNRGNDAVI